MFKALFRVMIGASLSWIITADHYGRILTGTPGLGLACRFNDMETAWFGQWGERIAYCIDLDAAELEEDVWQNTKDRITAAIREKEHQ